jgi:hypothetical protein
MKKSKKFIIIFIIVLIALVIGLLGQRKTKVENTAMGSSLESVAGNIFGGTTSNLKNQIYSEISFISTLSSVKNLKVDTSIFSNVLFSKLKDNSVKIESVEPGRPNPFAPINSNQSKDPTIPKVITTTPTLITDRSVVLNGQVNLSLTDKVTDIYFEYGPSENLGKVTPSVSQSLVGTFVKSVTGLFPRTAYFFKACARINQVVVCGEIVPFTTN